MTFDNSQPTEGTNRSFYSILFNHMVSRMLAGAQVAMQKKTSVYHTEWRSTCITKVDYAYFQQNKVPAHTKESQCRLYRMWSLNRCIFCMLEDTAFNNCCKIVLRLHWKNVQTWIFCKFVQQMVFCFCVTISTLAGIFNSTRLWIFHEQWNGQLCGSVLNILQAACCQLEFSVRSLN
jgi:hypothetical protein